ncbi:MAG: N-formylglutamate amidohydrolase [Desulfobacteraceae bacterium]
MTLPFLLSLPHCAANVPWWLEEQLALDHGEIYESVDMGSDEVFGSLPARRVIKAEFSRLVVDLNRGADQSGAKGVIAQTDYHGRRIYLSGRYPDPGQRAKLLDQCYHPFHEKLSSALADPGVQALFDCHSLEGTGPCDAPDAGEKRRDIVLSNNGDERGRKQKNSSGITCPPKTLALVRRAFVSQGFSVAVNVPYKGGFITRHYGQYLMEKKKFALQIELNQDLFLLSGKTVLDNDKIASTRKRVHAALAGIF